LESPEEVQMAGLLAVSTIKQSSKIIRNNLLSMYNENQFSLNVRHTSLLAYGSLTSRLLDQNEIKESSKKNSSNTFTCL